MHPGSMEHYPEIVNGDAKYLTDLLACKSVYLTEGECPRDTLGQWRQAPLKNTDEFASLEKILRIAAPIGRRVFLAPMADPFALLSEKLFVLEWLAVAQVERRFAARAAVMIDNLVLKYANKPGPFRAPAGKLLIGLQSGEKGFLNDILGHTGVAKAKNSILK
jgi:hypothetical protein